MRTLFTTIAAVFFMFAFAPMSHAGEVYPTTVIVFDRGIEHFEPGVVVAQTREAGVYEDILIQNLEFCVQNVDPMPAYYQDTGMGPNTSVYGPLGRLYSHNDKVDGRTNFTRERAEQIIRMEKQRCYDFEMWGHDMRGWGMPHQYY